MSAFGVMPGRAEGALLPGVHRRHRHSGEEQGERTPAYLYCQWATSKQMALNMVNMGGGASPRLSTYKDPTR